MAEHEKELGIHPVLIRSAIFIALLLLLLALALISLVIGFDEQRQAGLVAKAFHASVAAQKDPTDPDHARKAIQLAQFAYDERNPKQLDIVRNLYELYGQHQRASASAGSAAGRPYYPGVCFSLPPAEEVLSLDHYSVTDTSLKLYTLENSVVKYRQGSEAGGEQSLDLKPYTGNLQDFELGLSADGKKLQLLARRQTSPLYWSNGRVFRKPFLELYKPTPDEGNTGKPVVDTLEQYLGLYDLFAGIFVDKTGNTYTRENVAPFLAGQLTLSDTGFLVQINNQSKQLIQLDSLFSLRLYDEATHLLDLKSLAGLTTRPWWPFVHQREISRLPEINTAEQVELLEVAQAVYTGVLLWDRDSLHHPPSRTDLPGTAFRFLTALTDSTLLGVTPEGEISIMDRQAVPRRQLKYPGAAIREIVISADQRQLAYWTTSDSVFIWNLWGNLLHSYHQENIRRFFFSNNGSRLLSVSADQVSVWNAQVYKFEVYNRPADAPPITFARVLDEDQHITIGMSEAAENAAAPIEGSNRQTQVEEDKVSPAAGKSRLVYWDPNGAGKVFSQLPPGAILDAAVSPGGHHAIILQAAGATVISGPGAKKGLSLGNLFGAAGTFIPARQAGGQLTPLSISPGGRYLIRRSADDRRIELFDRSGKLANAFELPNGFQAGFRGQLFTPDDYYMIVSRPEEMWFWHLEHPGSGEIIQWARQFELSRREKQQYGLTSLTDYIPGKRPEAKIWALPLMLLSLLLILLYFSDFILEFVEGKLYLEFSLFLSSFILLIILLIVLWGMTPQIPEWNGVAFYAMTWTALALIAVWIFRNYYRPKKWGLLVVLLGGLVLMTGALNFFTIELVWQDALLGLLILFAFIGFFDQPVYRAVVAYEGGNSGLFYRRLLIPVAGLSLAFWGIFGWTSGGFQGRGLSDLLLWTSGVFLAGVGLQQIRRRLRTGEYLALAAYAVPAILLSLLLLMQRELFLAAIAGSFFLGRRYQQEEEDHSSFWYYSSCIFLCTGMVMLWGSSQAPAFWASRSLLIILFVLLLFALSKLLSKLSAGQGIQQKRALRRGLPAVPGIWVLGYAFTLAAFLITPEDQRYSEIAVETDSEPIDNKQLAGIPLRTSDPENRVLVRTEPQEDQEPAAPPPPVTEAPPPAPAEPSPVNPAPVAGAPSVATTTENPGPASEKTPATTPTPAADQPAARPSRPPADSDPKPPLNLAAQAQRRLLIEQLFSRSESLSRRALQELADSHTGSLALIDELLQAVFRHRDRITGIERVLTLLEMLPDQQLKGKSQLLEAFFNEIYNPQTAKSITALRGRLAS